ncbi:MAG: hypothetical protein QNJ34_21730 [Xenococcaceae cyanobacterium MO_188.B29]|nr:hypothetical protein [Xenococcaceae cyanobacterium MO_188.B29]
MIKKLFGGKSKEFFLELDEAGNNSSTETKAEETQPAPAAVTQAEDKQPEVMEVINVKPASKSKKTSIKSKKKKAAETTEPTPAPASVSSNGASSWDPPFWVKAMYNNNGSSNGKVEAGEKTFATDYLLPTPSSSRRRPGPSLNKFKDMARQAKTPRR